MREQVIEDIFTRLNRISEKLESHQLSLKDGLRGEIFDEYNKLLSAEEEKINETKRNFIHYLKM